MKGRDWRLLANLLPDEPNCNELQHALKHFAWGEGWQRIEWSPADKLGRKHLRSIERGVASKPFIVGPFRVERAGRWGIAFALDPAYAAQRAHRRRRRADPYPGGWDATFERLHNKEIEQRFANCFTGRADTYHETAGLDGPEMVRVGARHSESRSC
jgi:hypothetical protein